VVQRVGVGAAVHLALGQSEGVQHDCFQRPPAFQSGWQGPAYTALSPPDSS
jgi:hypothetical protein